MNTRVIEREVQRSTVGEIDFTPKQKDDWEVCVSWMVFQHPFFAHLLMAQCKVVGTHGVPVAATDGFDIFINPDTFFKHSVQEQGFIVCHEVLHCVFNDPVIYQSWINADKVRQGNVEHAFNQNAAQHAMDYIINAQLITAGVGKIPQGCLYDSKFSDKGMEAVVDIYPLVLADMPPQDPFDQLIQPKSKDQGGKTRDDDEWKQAIVNAAQAAEAQGKMPAGFERLVSEILNPKVSWQEHLRATLVRINGSDGMDWSYPDRRMMTRSRVGHDNVFFGRPSGFGAGTVVVGVDTSGSIGETQLAMFFAEMAGIMEEINPRELVVMWCDARVHRVDRLEEVEDLPGLRAKGAPGGGGTSFVPVFKRIDKLGLQPDMLVYLTDMYGSFPEEEPDYRVVWGTISTVTTAPFGTVVEIKD